MTIKLSDSTAENMGCGMFVVLQPDADLGKMQNVVLSERDIAAMRASTALTLSLEDGEAHYMGDDHWTVLQRDTSAQEPQSVVLCREDLNAMMAHSEA